MAHSHVIEKIDRLGLCIGCGLCESVCGKDAVEMQLYEDGFFHPKVNVVSPEKEEIISKICPGTNVVNDISFSKEERIWGHIEKLWSGFSTDNEIRTKGSSGGIVSGIAIHLLTERIVDGVLQVGGDNNDYERNGLKVSHSREDVLECASSRYAPALVFDKIFEILDSNQNTYCFIGKPCDISALKNLLHEFPEYTGRFKLTISIMCAGLPSFKGTEAIIDGFQAAKPISNLVYRGNGWPGYFSFIDSRGNAYQRTYNDSWGKTLNKYLKFRCKICPDGIGIQADIAVGDAWETKDGYPDFTEKEGQSLIIARTLMGAEILNKASIDKKIILENLETTKVRMMQPYQYTRRTVVGARILAILVKRKFLLNFKGLSVFMNMKKVKVLSLIREFIGTYNRIS